MNAHRLSITDPRGLARLSLFAARLLLAVAVLAMLVLLAGAPAQATMLAAGAPNNHTVLILSTSVVGGTSSREAVQAVALGFTVEMADATQWTAKLQADFSTYRAIILGDPLCSYSTSSVQAAIDNRSVWSPAVNGNIILIGTDPSFHSKDTVIQNAIRYAGAIPGKTGLYAALSCYYQSAPAGTAVPLLDKFGTFKVAGNSYDNIHIVAVHPVLAGLTDTLLSNWSQSSHEGFTAFPASFLPLAIQRGLTGPGMLTFADGSSGIPYIMARGEGLQAVGLNISKSGPATANVGNTATYTITYGNTGATNATSVVITDPVPSGTTFVSASGGGSLSGGNVVWNIGSLNAGVTGQTVTFTVTLNASGTTTNSNYTIAASGISPVTGAPVNTTVSGSPPPTPTATPTGTLVAPTKTPPPPPPPPTPKPPAEVPEADTLLLLGGGLGGLATWLRWQWGKRRALK
jgi:uncharacterized repeat protein (TIGR01451 family)